MAENITIGGSGSLFVGEDKIILLELVSKGTTTAVDMTGWVMVFDVRRSDTAVDPAILSKTPSIIGVFNATQALNTQRASVSLTDDDLNLFRAKAYRWTWKRMDAGSETVLAWGSFSPQKATAP